MTSPGNMPAAEVEVTVATMRGLLGSQRPDLADRDVSPLSFGWDNVSFRVGPDLVARLPRRTVAVELLGNEARWLPGLAPELPLPIPAPVYVGEPDEGYPWPWTLVPFIPGETPAEAETFDQEGCAVQLAGFLRALHRPAPEGAPANPYRGTPLVDRAPSVRERLESLGELVDRPSLEEVWSRALAAPDFPGPPRWLHGDLHPMNLLVVDGSLSGVIDFGDLTAGDPATDLAVAWMLFDDRQRAVFRSSYGGGDDDIWVRSIGWALSLGLAYLAHSADNPAMARIGQRTLAAVVESA